MKYCYMCLGMKHTQHYHTQVFEQTFLISVYPGGGTRNKFRKYLLLFSAKPLTTSFDGTFTILKLMIYVTIFQFILHDCETHILVYTLKELGKLLVSKNKVVTKITGITGMKEWSFGTLLCNLLLPMVHPNLPRHTMAEHNILSHDKGIKNTMPPQLCIFHIYRLVPARMLANTKKI